MSSCSLPPLPDAVFLHSVSTSNIQGVSISGLRSTAQRYLAEGAEQIERCCPVEVWSPCNCTVCTVQFVLCRHKCWSLQWINTLLLMMRCFSPTSNPDLSPHHQPTHDLTTVATCWSESEFKTLHNHRPSQENNILDKCILVIHNQINWWVQNFVVFNKFQVIVLFFFSASN